MARDYSAGNPYPQCIPSTCKEIVRAAVSWAGPLANGSTFTISASNPASSIVSITAGFTFCDFTTIRAEWLMRSTTALETPSTSDSRRVRVFEQAAHVIPPMERVKAAGSSSLVGSFEFFGTPWTPSEIGTSVMALTCVLPDWQSKHWVTCFLCLAANRLEVL